MRIRKAHAGKVYTRRVYTRRVDTGKCTPEERTPEERTPFWRAPKNYVSEKVLRTARAKLTPKLLLRQSRVAAGAFERLEITLQRLKDWGRRARE